MNKRTRKKGSEAEILLQRQLEERGWLVHRAQRSTRRFNNRVITESHDLFGVFDLLAVRGHSTWAIQVTTPNGRSARKKKIADKHKWPKYWLVSVATHETTEDPSDRRKKKNFWRFDLISTSKDGVAKWISEVVDFDGGLT